MADSYDRRSVDQLLRQAALAMPEPDMEELARTVTFRLRAMAGTNRASRPSALPRPPMRLARVAAALLTISAAIAALAPPVRSAVGDFLGVDGVHITRGGPVPTTPATPAPRKTPATTTTTLAPDPIAALHLGTPTTLADAARLVGFAMRIPTTPTYQQPDVVLVADFPAGRMVSMVYLPRQGRPAVPGQAVAGLLSEFRARLDAGFFLKLAGAGTTVQPVLVGGTAGYWLSGSPHQFFYVAPDGSVDTETIRLATNTLVWSAGGITYRFESGLSMQEAIGVATSMR